MTTSQITLPAPRTWALNDLVLVPRLRADVTDAVALLTQKPMAVLQSTIGYNVPGGGGVVPMDAELTDTWGGHLEDLSPAFLGFGASYWCQLPGWYLADVRMPFIYNSATPEQFIAGVAGISGGLGLGALYGPAMTNGSGQGTTARAVDLIPLSRTGPPNGSGDLIQPWAYAGSSGTIALNTSSVNLPTASFRWALALSGTAPLPVPPLTACPTPITSAWLNADVRDTINFLAYPPALKARYVAGASALANSTLATPQVVPLSTADLDNYGGLVTGASAAYTIPRAGRYLVAGQVNLAASSTATYCACGVLVNGATLYWGTVARFAGTSLAGGAGITRRLRFSQGDTVQLAAAQASGGAIAYHTASTNQTRLICLWEGL